MVRLSHDIVNASGDMAEMVKCKDCGFLTGKTNHGFLKAEHGYREYGVVGGEEIAPVCFRRAYQLEEEWKATFADGKPKKTSELKKIFDQNRDCDTFMLWVYDCTAKEHYEMLISEKALEEQQRHAEIQREWEKERLQLERDRDEDAERRHQAILNEARTQFDKMIDEGRSAGRWGVWKSIGLAIFGALLTLAVQIINRTLTGD